MRAASATPSPTFQIRGISGGGGATGERGVGFYVDNVFMPRTTGPVMRVLDVERIEVLRGPQGTLFGRNSTGGAIRVFSRQPEPERDGYLRVTLGNFDHQDVQGMINVPLGDDRALRAQVASSERRRLRTSRPARCSAAARTRSPACSSAWEPSDALTLTFGALHSDSESDGSPTDMTIFNMDPICPLDPAIRSTACKATTRTGSPTFSQTSGQARLRQNDAASRADDYTMPDWCFLDDANPDWDDLCRQWNDVEVHASSTRTSTGRSPTTCTLISTTGVSEFESSGVSDWQLLGMEFRPVRRRVRGLLSGVPVQSSRWPTARSISSPA